MAGNTDNSPAWDLNTPNPNPASHLLTRDIAHNTHGARREVQPPRLRLDTRGLSNEHFVYGPQGGLGKSRNRHPAELAIILRRHASCSLIVPMG